MLKQQNFSAKQLSSEQIHSEKNQPFLQDSGGGFFFCLGWLGFVVVLVVIFILGLFVCVLVFLFACLFLFSFPRKQIDFICFAAFKKT